MEKKQLKFSFHDFLITLEEDLGDVGAFEVVNEAVCNYISKHLGEDVTSFDFEYKNVHAEIGLEVNTWREKKVVALKQ